MNQEAIFKLKIVLFVVGASLGMAGMLTERRWLVWLGIGVLAVGVIVRLLARRINPND